MLPVFRAFPAHQLCRSDACFPQYLPSRWPRPTLGSPWALAGTAVSATAAWVQSSTKSCPPPKYLGSSTFFHIHLRHPRGGDIAFVLECHNCSSVLLNSVHSFLLVSTSFQNFPEDTHASCLSQMFPQETVTWPHPAPLLLPLHPSPGAAPLPKPLSCYSVEFMSSFPGKF